MTVQMLHQDSFFNMLLNFNLAATFQDIRELLEYFGTDPRVVRKAQQRQEDLLFKKELSEGHTCCDDVETPLMPELYICDGAGED